MPLKLPGLKLPLARLSGPSVATPDAVRRRLGGRAESDRGVGDVVLARTAGGEERAAVVLFARGDERWVWLAEGLVRRVREADTRPTATPAHLDDLARSARVFALLVEGQAVRFETDAGVAEEGTLVEKCRFGALVVRPDGAVVGVGFRRLWPASAGLSA